MESDYDTYRHARIHEAISRNRQWRDRFQLSSWPRWDRDENASTLVFSKDGFARVLAEVVVVGCVEGNRWEWSWGNPYMPKLSREKMDEVRSFGEGKGWKQLTTLFLESDDFLGWECTAIAAHILDAEGGYRCPNSDGSGFVYVLAFDTRFVS